MNWRQLRDVSQNIMKTPFLTLKSFFCVETTHGESFYQTIGLVHQPHPLSSNSTDTASRLFLRWDSPETKYLLHEHNEEIGIFDKDQLNEMK